MAFFFLYFLSLLFFGTCLLGSNYLSDQQNRNIGRFFFLVGGGGGWRRGVLEHWNF